jgi:biopolymer transport protein ExbD
MGSLHYVNVILLVIFFSLFGSRFVLSPGLGVDFELPRLEGARAGAARTPYYINVLRSGQIFTDDGLVDMGQLHDWLRTRAARETQPTLLIRASADVKLSELVEIRAAARDAGFGNVLIGAEDRSGGQPAPESK